MLGQRAISAAQPMSDELIGNVWALSQDAEGCRRVQQALEDGGEDIRNAIALELRGHVIEALHNPHANFVVRKCVEKLAPPDVQFIVDEMLATGPSAISEAARHRYGCRIMEALFAHCPPNQLWQVAELFLTETPGLCSHLYGNFVMQRLLRSGTPDQRARIIEVLCAQAATLGPSFYASAVIGAALRTAPDADRVRIAQALAAAGVLPAMSRFKHGPEIVELALQHLDAATQQTTRQELATAAAQRQQAAALAAAASAEPKALRVQPHKQSKQRVQQRSQRIGTM